MSEENILKVIGREAGEAVASIQNALDDGKFGLADGIDVAKEVGTLVLPIISRREELVAAVKDGIDLAEEGEFKEGFLAGYDVTNDELESTVENVFSGVVTVVSGLVRIFVKDDDAE